MQENKLFGTGRYARFSVKMELGLDQSMVYRQSATETYSSLPNVRNVAEV